MIHVLLTPPETPETPETIGILHVGCVPPWAARVFDAMDEEGWIVGVVFDPPADFPETSPPRVLGQEYFNRFMQEHPALRPFDPRNN